MLPDIGNITNSLMQSWPRFLPELVVCGGIVVLLLLRLVARGHVGPLALVVTLGALLIAVCQWAGIPGSGFEAPNPTSPTMFDGLLVYDHLTIFLRLLLLGFAALMCWLTLTTGIPDREDSADFYTLLLGATLGMMLMASANHLLDGLHRASRWPACRAYALAGFLKGRRQSSEAALKYVVYGGGAAGVMLYGISLLAGRFGTGYLPDRGRRLRPLRAGPGRSTRC